RDAVVVDQLALAEFLLGQIGRRVVRVLRITERDHRLEAIFVNKPSQPCHGVLPAAVKDPVLDDTEVSTSVPAIKRIAIRPGNEDGGDSKSEQNSQDAHIRRPRELQTLWRQDSDPAPTAPVRRSSLSRLTQTFQIQLIWANTSAW